MKASGILAFAAFMLFNAGAGAATLFVSVNGNAGASGTEAAPFGSLAAAAEIARPGDTIRVGPGTYRPESTIEFAGNGNASAVIRVEAAGPERPIFDFSNGGKDRRAHGFAVSGDYWHLVGLEVTGAAGFGISLTGHHNVTERCRAHANQNTGINLGAPASDTLVLDCESYRNVDFPTRGQNADGFGAKFNVGPGIVFRGCRAWENADDGFDLWKAPHPVRIENCVAYRNGLDLWKIEGFTGNGNGFKVGGDFVAAAHVIVGCVAIDQPKRGFDQNNNTGPLLFERCTAIHCGKGFSVILATKSGEPNVLRDNVAWDAPAVLVHGTVEENNLWSGADGSAVPASYVDSAALTRNGMVPYDPARSSGPPPRTPPTRSFRK
ncbi:MAG: right-handed parallel beta-helix repeat-containing protein [Opitutaceae bacterium]|nr:right-handed parallel beta-helix repeat-containing protein [Opitutaceae bacterium]